MQAALDALIPWRGGAADEMADLTCPPARATVVDLGQRLEAAVRAREAALAELARREEVVAERKAALDGLDTVGDDSLEEAARTRTRREAAWATHRAQLDADSAETFEQAMRQDDRVTATLADRTARAERAREATIALTRAEAQLGESQAGGLNAAQAAQEKLRAELATLRQAISPPSLPKDMGAAALADWLDRWVPPGPRCARTRTQSEP